MTAIGVATVEAAEQTEMPPLNESDSWQVCTDFEVVLNARNIIYAFFQRAFAQEPTIALVRAFTMPSERASFDLLLDDSPYVFEARCYIDSLEDLEIDDLEDEYTRALIGPEKLAAPPWESVYVNDEKLLLQESTLQVREAYAREGFVPQGYPKVADDHLAMELHFMLMMGERATDHLQSNPMRAKEALLVQRDFLESHLSVWVGDYAACLRKAKDCSFYSALADVLEAFILTDGSIVDELLGVLDGA